MSEHLTEGERVVVLKGAAKGCHGEVLAREGWDGPCGPLLKVRLDKGSEARKKDEGCIREDWCEREGN
jgi:hypothetical protein